MRGWERREVLPSALARAMGHHSGGARAPEAGAPRALEPGRSIVVMPDGGVYIVEGGGRQGARSAADMVAPLPAMPGDLESRDMESLLGHEAPCGLACALCARVTRSDDPRLDAVEIARGDDPPAEGSEAQILPTRFWVRREELEGASHTAIVGRIMEGVWEIEERLCGKEVSTLPGYQITPKLADMIRQGRLEEFLVHINAETGSSVLDTAIVGNDMLHRVCSACPGLAAVEPYSGILRNGPLTVLAHGGFAGQAVLLSSRLGPALVHGPTVIRCGDAGLDIGHYCRVVDQRGRRLRGMVRGIRIVTQP